MDAATVVEIVGRLENSGISVWLDGGWGVDALLERQTREHDDLDLVGSLEDSDRIVDLLAQLGYEVVSGGAPKSFVLVDEIGRQVDIHPVAFTVDGSGLYEMDDSRKWTYPAQGFTGRGRVGGVDVRCLSPEVQVLVHAGYELGQKDYRELYLLRERFGVAVPAELLGRVIAAAR